MQYLYHGSSIQNLKELNPQKSRHQQSYVYAVSELAFALLFSVPVRNSLVGKWGRLKNGTPYFCEKKHDIFNLLYGEKQSSIYVLNSKNFTQKKNMWQEEYVSKQDEEILEEIKVKDIKEYLLKLEEEGNFKLISYKDRKDYFPNIDSETITHAMRMIEKYGEEKALIVIKKWRPEILEDVKRKLSEK